MGSATEEKSTPSEFNSATDSIPIIDFSLLTTSGQDQRSRILHDLDSACREWGFYILVNHGIPESLLKAMIASSSEFFDLPAEEKRRYETEGTSDPIQCGSGSYINTAANIRIHLWRDFVKSYVHPEFHCPHQPQALRDNLSDYTKRTRSVFRELMHAVGENLGFEEGYVDRVLQLDSCFQLYVANYYPPCPEPDQAVGLPPHTDPSLMTFLVHNGVSGLQIEHNGEWLDTVSPENSILVFNADHLEIFSNGRYKGVSHRAVLNTEATRISIAMAMGTAPDAIVAPAPPLVEKDGRSLFRPMKFIEYHERMLNNGLSEKTNLECIKIEQKK